MNFGRARRAVQILLHVLLAGHIAAWYLGGWRGAGSVSAAGVFYLLQVGLVNAGVLLVGTALLSTPLLGNAFCGWACHFGALQDFAAWLFRKIGVKPLAWTPPVRLRWLLFVKLFLLNTVATWLALGALPELFVRCGAPEPLFAIGTWVTVLLDVAVLAFATTWIFGPRAFCRTVCPVILVARLGNAVAPGRMALAGTCVDCGACDRACPMGNPVSAMLRGEGAVGAADCVRCGRCADACPVRAIAFRFGRPARAPKPPRPWAVGALVGAVLGLVGYEVLAAARAAGWAEPHLPNWEFFYAALGAILGAALTKGVRHALAPASGRRIDRRRDRRDRRETPVARV